MMPAAASAWAPASHATVHPGVMTFTAGGQCTANFIYTDSGGTYIGQAAHCAEHRSGHRHRRLPVGSLPLGTPVEVTGASRPGTLVYSSWLTMQATGETDADTCAYNDLALVQIDPGRRRQGQPVGARLRRPDRRRRRLGGPATTVYSYGNSSLR